MEPLPAAAVDALAARGVAEGLEHALERRHPGARVECRAWPTPGREGAWGVLAVTTLPLARVREAAPCRVVAAGAAGSRRAVLLADAVPSRGGF